MKVLYTIVAVLIILFIISFSLQNATDVTLTYYDLLGDKGVTFPTYMLMFIAFLVGVAFTGLLGFTERLNLTRNISQLNKTVRDLRRELRSNDALTVDSEQSDNLTEP
ncbi:MAG TPA: LapA family protein [Syntrophales bacterium]|nr:LapA family protein [Syntrophales bacterium]